MRIIETKVYTIEEHPNKKKCFDWIRNNWYDINQYSVDEVINSLKSLQEKIGGELDYSISSVPDRSEHITFKDYDHEELRKLIPEDYSLTGLYWDFYLIVGLREGKVEKVLECLHSDTEYQYSDEGLFEMCVANEYEFKENGDYHKI